MALHLPHASEMLSLKFESEHFPELIHKVPPVNFGIRPISFLSPSNSEVVVVQVVVEAVDVVDVDAVEWQLNWERKTVSKIVAGQCEKLRSLTGLNRHCHAILVVYDVTVMGL